MQGRERLSQQQIGEQQGKDRYEVHIGSRQGHLHLGHRPVVEQVGTKCHEGAEEEDDPHVLPGPARGPGRTEGKGREEEHADEGLQRSQCHHAVAAGELLEYHGIGGGAEHGAHLQAVAEQGVGRELVGALPQPQQGDANDGDGKAQQLAATHPLSKQHEGHQSHHQGKQGTDHAGLAGTGVTQGVDFQKEVEAGLKRPHQGQPAPIPLLVSDAAKLAVAEQPATGRHPHPHEEHLTEGPDFQHMFEGDEGAGPEQHGQGQRQDG